MVSRIGSRKSQSSIPSYLHCLLLLRSLHICRRARALLANCNQTQQRQEMKEIQGKQRQIWNAKEIPRYLTRTPSKRIYRTFDMLCSDGTTPLTSLRNELSAEPLRRGNLHPSAPLWTKAGQRDRSCIIARVPRSRWSVMQALHAQ